MHGFSQVSDLIFSIGSSFSNILYGFERLSVCPHVTEVFTLASIPATTRHQGWSLLCFCHTTNTLKVLGKHCKVTSPFFSFSSWNFPWLYGTRTNLASQDLKLMLLVYPLYTHSISPFVQKQRESRASFSSVDMILSTIEF